MADWITDSLAFLTASQGGDGGWSYFAGGESAIEPTASAAAAIAAHSGDRAKIDRGIQFILKLQDKDGSIRPEPSSNDPTTMAAYAATVIDAVGNDRRPAARTADYLLSYDPVAPPRDPKSDISDDSSIKGFAWRPRTYSWVDPTAYAMILMYRLGRGSEPRVGEARRMLLDRAVPEGGWNYGNSQVFGKSLEPAEMPTALALLALWDDTTSPQVTNAIAYLLRQKEAPSVLTLAWVRIALAARGKPAPGTEKFGELFAVSRRSAGSPWHRAMALLAAGPLEKNPFIIRETR